jgi:hypothetical protein
MKSTFFIVAIFATCQLFAQIKIVNGGNVFMGQPINPSNQVIIGSSSTLYQTGKLQVAGHINPALVINQWNGDIKWGWASISRADQRTTKHWIVDLLGKHNFFVTTEGDVFAKNKFLKMSDSSFKFNVKAVSDPMQKIMQMRGVTYQVSPHAYCEECVTDTLDSAALQPVRYGFIAQEMENVIPEVVTTLPDNTKALEYTDLIPVLVEGIKYQAMQLQNLQDQINTCCSTSNNLIKATGSLNTGQNIPLAMERASTNLSKAELYQNEPNPFSQSTTIKYNILETTKSAYVILYDMQGKQIKKYSLSKGSSQITVNANELSAGMYLYSLIADNKEVDTKRMIVTD